MFGRRLRNVSRTSQDRVADVGAMVSEVLGAMKIVQAFNQEARERSRFGVAVERTSPPRDAGSCIRAAMTAMHHPDLFGSITLIMWRGAIGVATGAIRGGTIAAFVITGGLVAGSFGALTEVYGDLLRGAGRGQPARPNCSTKSPASPPPARPAGAARSRRAGSLSFRERHLPLSDPARKCRRCTISPSTSSRARPSRIVGPSGAGKSTMFQLAERFYDPQAGTVRIDGVPLTSRRSRRNPPPHRAGAAGRGAVRRQRARQPALRQVGRQRRRDLGSRPRRQCRGFLRELPDGLDTFLGEDGARLRADSASASRSPAPCCAIRRSCCSTRRPARSMPKASGWSRTRSTG